MKPPASFQTCPMCGAVNGDRATVCVRCGEALKLGHTSDHGFTRKEIREFRTQTLSLGAIWLILAMVYLIVAAVFAPIVPGRDLIPLEPGERWIISGVAGLLCVSHFILGGFTLRKSLTGLKAGVAFLSMLAMVTALASCLCVLPVAIFFPFYLLSLFQAVRTARWAQRFTDAGIPLSIRPEELPENLRQSWDFLTRR